MLLMPYARNYVLAGLDGTPDVLEALVSALPESKWDNRPDPERFTLREMVAHLADWEPIWLERARRIVEENHPTLPSYDEGQLAIDHDYAHQSLPANLVRFREGRAANIAFLSSVVEEVWERTATREGLGELTLAGQTAMILGHDGYHTHQAVLWSR